MPGPEPEPEPEAMAKCARLWLQRPSHALDGGIA